MSPAAYVKAVPGELYLHYKGGKYLVVCVAQTHEHTDDRDVVYVSLTHASYTTRPLNRDSRKQDSWTDSVTWPDGKTRLRFIALNALSTGEARSLQRLGFQIGEQK